MSAAQARQAREVASQVGAVPRQSLAPLHPTQVLLAALQKGVAPVHTVALAVVHCTQAPEVVLQAVVPVRAAHWASAVQLPQLREVLPQTGAEAGQSASVRQAAQTLRVRSQSVEAPVHADRLAAVHSTHAPEVLLHAGVAARGAQSVSAVQPPQVWLLVLHTGAPTPQSTLVRQPTQVELATSQKGVAPVHAAALVALHCTHAPDDVSHTGRAPAHSLFAAHARQAWEVVSQTGVAPEHAALVAQPKAPPLGVTVPAAPAAAPVQPEPAAPPPTLMAQPVTASASNSTRPPPPPPPGPCPPMEPPAPPVACTLPQVAAPKSRTSTEPPAPPPPAPSLEASPARAPLAVMVPAPVSESARRNTTPPPMPPGVEPALFC